MLMISLGLVQSNRSVISGSFLFFSQVESFSSQSWQSSTYFLALKSEVLRGCKETLDLKQDSFIALLKLIKIIITITSHLPSRSNSFFGLLQAKCHLIKEIIYYNQMEQNQNQEDKPIYIHRFPYRFVKPYPFTYRTFAKGRWVGKPLLPTLIKEFKAYSPDYYQHSIQIGRIKVNDKVVSPEYVLRNGDEIVHVSLRVEPPVLDLPIDIVDESDEFLVIDKPPSIIVHTGGGHHYNTIESLLKYQHHYKNLHILHRLDKCTSGLLIFAKDKQKVALFHQQSGKQVMKKMYYARVTGNFPWQEKQLSAFIECLSHKDGVYRVAKEIELPLLKANQQQTYKQAELEQKPPKDVANQQSLNGPKKFEKYEKNADWKDSRTIFKRVWYDEETDSSLLECYPVTGRTHQIRVHLQYLGFPILNDVGYGGRFVGNKIIEKIKRKKQQEYGEEGQPQKKLKINQETNVEDWDYENKPWQIMLHSFHYQFGGREFQTTRPYWYYKQRIARKTGQIQ